MGLLKDTITAIYKSRQQVIKVHPKGDSIREQSLTFFDDVWGLEDVKENVYRGVISEDLICLMLYGPPAGAKTLIMECIRNKCNDVFYFDATNMSSAGLIEELYLNQHAKIIIIDEIGRLKSNDLDSLRSLLNNGEIVKTLKKTKYHIRMPNVKVFATTNDIDFDDAILSRFETYHILPYTDEEFIKVTQFALRKKISYETAELIAQFLILHEKKDVRHAKKIVAKINEKVDTEADITRVMENWANRQAKEKIDYN